MAFCRNCGKQIQDTATFCDGCGAAVNNQSGSQTQRTTVYDGAVHKCPSCGGVMNSFSAVCPLCGWEVRSKEPAASVKELSRKLAIIDAKKYENSKIKEKANLIINFPISNTKKDILEFLLLADVNIKSSSADDKILITAWKRKKEQVIRQAEIALPNDVDFINIKKEILQEAQAEKERKKLKYKLILLGGIVGIISIVIGIMIIVNLSDNKDKENNALILEIEQLIEEEKYSEAREKINDLPFSFEIDSTKEKLLNEVEEKEAAKLGKLQIGLSQKEFYERDCFEMQNFLETRGFTNIKVEQIKDLTTGWLVKDGSIEEVFVNGRLDFDPNKYYIPDVEIIIRYHTFKK